MNKVCCILLSLLCAAFSVEKTWTPPAHGRWDVSTNWTPAGVPAVGDSCVLNSSNNYNCSLTTNITIQSLRVKNGYTGRLVLRGDSLVINNQCYIEAYATGGRIIAKHKLMRLVHKGNNSTFLGADTLDVDSLYVIKRGSGHFRIWCANYQIYIYGLECNFSPSLPCTVTNVFQDCGYKNKFVIHSGNVHLISNWRYTGAVTTYPFYDSGTVTGSYDLVFAPVANGRTITLPKIRHYGSGKIYFAPQGSDSITFNMTDTIYAAGSLWFDSYVSNRFRFNSNGYSVESNDITLAGYGTELYPMYINFAGSTVRSSNFYGDYGNDSGIVTTLPAKWYTSASWAVGRYQTLNYADSCILQFSYGNSTIKTAGHVVPNIVDSAPNYTFSPVDSLRVKGSIEHKYGKFLLDTFTSCAGFIYRATADSLICTKPLEITSGNMIHEANAKSLFNSYTLFSGNATQTYIFGGNSFGRVRLKKTGGNFYTLGAFTGVTLRDSSTMPLTIMSDNALRLDTLILRDSSTYIGHYSYTDSIRGFVNIYTAKTQPIHFYSSNIAAEKKIYVPTAPVTDSVHFTIFRAIGLINPQSMWYKSYHGGGGNSHNLTFKRGVYDSFILRVWSRVWDTSRVKKIRIYDTMTVANPMYVRDTVEYKAGAVCLPWIMANYYPKYIADNAGGTTYFILNGVSISGGVGSTGYPAIVSKKTKVVIK